MKLSPDLVLHQLLMNPHFPIKLTNVEREIFQWGFSKFCCCENWDSIRDFVISKIEIVERETKKVLPEKGASLEHLRRRQRRR